MSIPVRPLLSTIVCFISAVVAWGTVFYGHSVYMDALMREHGWSSSLISSAILIFWLASLPGTLTVGFLVDRYGSAIVVAIGGACIGSGLCLLGRIDEPWQLFVVYAAMGFGYPALAAAAISATLAPWFEHGFGLSLGIALTGASVGGAVLPPIIVQATAIHGFYDTMIATGSAVLVIIFCIVLTLLFVGRPHHAQTQADRTAVGFSMGSTVGNTRFWLLAIPAALGLGGQVGFLAHQVPLISGQTDQLTAALSVMVVAVASAVGRILVGILSRYMAIGVLTAATYAMHGFGLAMLAISSSTSSIFVACATTGLTVGAIVMLPPIIVRQVYGTATFGRTYAVVNVVMYTFAGLSPWFVGLLRDWTDTYEYGLWMLVAMELVSAALILVAFQRRNLQPEA